jgi:hypothetical protein
MVSEGQRDKNEAQLVGHFEEMYRGLYEWREAHPEASFDEIAKQLTSRRRVLMGEILGQLACQHGNGQVVEGLVCSECGEAMEYKGEAQRGVTHLEGETRLKRAYYYCAHCESGIFPPGQAIEVAGTQLDAGDD